jgi:uncharacterized Zn finger protein (UPF0148 family)
MRLTKFTCPHCEAVLKNPNGVETGKKIRCPKCQAAFTVTAPEDEEERVQTRHAAAPKAKKALPAEEEEDEEQAERASRKKGTKATSKPAPNRLPLIIGGSVVLLVGVGVGLFFMLRGDKKKANQGASNQPGSSKPAKPLTNKEKIIGTWLVTAGPRGLEIPSNMEFTRDGRAINTRRTSFVNRTEKIITFEMGYAVDGDSIKLISTELPGEPPKTGKITTLTEKLLVLDFKEEQLRFVRRVGGSIPVPREKPIEVTPGDHYTAEVGQTVGFLFSSAKIYAEKLQVQIDGKPLADPRLSHITGGSSGPLWTYTPEEAGTFRVQVVLIGKGKKPGEPISLTLNVTESPGKPPPSDPQPSGPPPAPDQVLTAEAVTKDLAVPNWEAVSKKYLGRTLTIEGVIIISDPLLIFLKGCNDESHVGLYISQRSSPQAAQLKEGQRVKVRGKCREASMIDLRLANCEILEPAAVNPPIPAPGKGRPKGPPP